MNKFIFRTSVLAAATLAAFSLTSCSDSNNDMMMDMVFKDPLLFENIVTPKDFVESGSFQGVGTPPIILPGQSVSVKFSAGKAQAFNVCYDVRSFKDWFLRPNSRYQIV